MGKKLTKVEFTNLNKVLYPSLKATKAQVIEYYIRIAPKMLPALANRPLVLTRFPEGVEEEGFYEKNAPQGTPDWVKTLTRYSETAERNIHYIICNNLDTLLWLANLAALEIHMTLSSAADSFIKPDLVLFDMDPKPPAAFDEVIEVALQLRKELDALGLKSFAKTSGKKGLHVVVPIAPEYTFQETRTFARSIGKKLERQSPFVTSEFSRQPKPGVVFMDYLQNSHGKTMACPYSLRATPQATVSTPLEWKQLKKGLKPEDFNMSSVVLIKENPWKGFSDIRQELEVNAK
jgi:bifunctional non-homologous end joining protein LigD